jgi:hypothetical protein
VVIAESVQVSGADEAGEVRPNELGDSRHAGEVNTTWRLGAG